MSNGGVEDEELRRRKLEEALEVKSLRRIISAYLNYPDAAEEDVKRYERSFRRLPPAHKALLSHLPLKFQRLRWCISKNSFFIFNMLQAFDPPLDMSQDTDVCEPENLKNVSDCNTSCCEKNVCSDQSASAWGQMSSVESDEDYSRVGGNSTCRSPHMVPVNKEEKLVHYNEFGCGSSASSQCNENLDISGGVDVKSLSNEAATCSLHDCNGNFQVSERCELLWNLDCVVILSCSLKLGDANELGYKVVEAVSLFPPDASAKVSSLPSDWLDRSFQLHVPLVDVDKSDDYTDDILAEIGNFNIAVTLQPKVRCIIRNIVRDWAAEGQRERDQCYKPILEELEAQFPDRWKDNPSCLVPGAGLGRLALEISCRGFVCQGNEFSYYMMICSSFILNHAQTVGEWTIYPWIHSNCNSLSDSDQLRPVLIPDVHPASAGITEGFSMCGGDFVEVYSDLSQIGIWDAVVTCFFIDTAHNVVEYIEIISRILRDGGVWINFGPLLYHFADMYGQQDEMSIELSLEDVKRVALHYGLQLEKESTIETTYTTNPQSMMQNRYYAAFWTMRKKEMATEQQQGT